MIKRNNRTGPVRIAIVLVAVVAATGCGDEKTTADSSETTQQPAVTEVAGSIDPDPATAEPPASEPDGEPSEQLALPESGFERQPAPGTYHLGAIGLRSVAFDLGEGFAITSVAGVGENSPFGNTTVRLTDRSRGGPGRLDIIITRPTHLLAPSFIGPPQAGVVTPDDLWPVGDIRQWLNEAESGGEWGVTDVVEVAVDGRSAITFVLESDYVGCEGRDEIEPGFRDSFTGCNGGIAWDMDTDSDNGGRISVEGWDGGRGEYLWIDDVDGKPLVVSLQHGWDTNEEWAARARAVLESVSIQ